MTNSPNDDADEPVTKAVHVDIAKDAQAVAFARLLRDGTIQYDVHDPTHPPDWADQESFFRRMGEQLVPPLRPRPVTRAVLHTAEAELADGWRKTVEAMIKAPNYHYVCSWRRPKRSDVTDEQVIQASIDAVNEHERNWIFKGGAPSRSTLAMLIENTGTPRKVALAAIRRAESRSYVKAITAKISIENACPTPEGRHFLATRDLRDRISGLEKKLREARKVKPELPVVPGGMTPAQHYVKAEDLLASAAGIAEDDGGLMPMLTEAQVHATLATYRKVEK